MQQPPELAKGWGHGLGTESGCSAGLWWLCRAGLPRARSGDAAWGRGSVALEWKEIRAGLVSKVHGRA